jgi:hydroxymethylglutaryl-CoA synthase
MAGICSYGAYVPLLRLRRESMAQLGGFAGPGEKAVANFDEDSLTMAVEAAIDCLGGVDRQTIDGLFFASTTPPLLEKQIASIAATVADLREEIFTVDCTDSLRAGTSSLRLAMDAVKAGSAKRVLVTAADCRMGIPLSGLEQNLGDGAAALLVGNSDVIASIEGSYSISSAYIDLWRPADDKFVHSWQDRFALNAGYQPIAQKAISEAMKRFGLGAKDLAKVIFYAPDARSHANLGKSLGFGAKQIQDPLFEVMGNTGAAFPLMLLVAALENAKAGDKILLASYGDGVDVLILQVTKEIEKVKGHRGMKGYLKSKRMLPSYLRYLRMRHLFPVDRTRFADVIPGLAQLWRERNSLLKYHGSKCKECGWVEFPIRRICPKCLEKDNFEEVRLTDKKATLFSFSTDTNPLTPGTTDSPMGRGVVDFEGGGRMEGEMTDWGDNIEELEVGMPVEMAFRRFERQGDVPAYSWKPRPVR